MPRRYEQITFRPEGARRNRTVILRDPKIRGMFLTGVQINREGDEIASGGADERMQIIDTALVTSRQPMIMDLHYAKLVPASHPTAASANTVDVENGL